MVVVGPTAIALASTVPAQDGPGAAASTPQTTIDGGPSGPTATASPSFSFSSPQGAAVRFGCRLDAAGFLPCESPQTLDDLPDGTHTFYVRAGDGVGHHDPTPASATFVVDTEPPAASIDSGPSGPTDDPRPAFDFSSPEGSAAFSCSLLAAGEQVFGPCSGVGTDQPASDLADGSYTFTVQTTDEAGNASAVARDFAVDTQAPTVSVESGPTGSTDDPRPTFAFASPDATAAFACSIDTGHADFGPCSGDLTDEPASGLGPDDYTFRVQATDPAGNATVATREFEVQDPEAEAKGSFKSSAPQPVPAWYMTARGRGDLKRQARNDACAFARRQPNRTRVLLMDFGKADKHHGEFGARLRSGSHFSNQEILAALKSAADSYRSNGRCYSRGSVRITYGNTNNMPNWLSRKKVRKAGRKQAMMANRLSKYARRKGRHYRHTGVGVAGDIEPQWNKPRVSKSLVHGATAHERGGLYFNYGAASQCPPETSKCANNWSVRNLGQVSYGGVKRPLPEIYRPVHVKQWTNVRRRWNNQHRYHHFCFYGATATPGFPLSNRKGWARLDANNRCVKAELVNIREQ